ncbi:hypothetical protein ACSBR1_017210 [Camellia fascicularis]
MQSLHWLEWFKGDRRAIIYVKSRVYNEKVEIGKKMKNLMFVGNGIDKTIITGSRNVVDGATTLSSAHSSKYRPVRTVSAGSYRKIGVPIRIWAGIPVRMKFAVVAADSRYVSA